MTTADKVFSALQRLAREQGRPVNELMVLYGLERTLDRLTRTLFADKFILKGGVLLAAFDERRVTRDIDLQARLLTVGAQRLREVAEAIAGVDVDDGLVYDTDDITVETIREGGEYEGLRVRFRARLRAAPLAIQLDVSTGDPIWPHPEPVMLPGLLGDDVTMLGHPMVMIVAEKAVTVLQRGITSTRWRDYMDIVNLSRAHPFTAGELHETCSRVAQHRGVQLGPIEELVQGYGAIGQTKWASWRTKNGAGDRTEPMLDDQMTHLVRFVDPIFSGEVTGQQVWDAPTRTWN